MRRYALRDDQWDRIKDFLPGREGHVGGTAADNRLFVEAVLYRYRAGLPWRDLPERFGDWKIIHQGFSRWAKSGILLACDHENAYIMVPSREWLEFEGDVISSLFAQTESALVRRWRSRHENEYHKSYSGIG